MATVCLVSAASSRAGRRSVVRIIRSIRPAIAEAKRQRPGLLLILLLAEALSAASSANRAL